MVDGSGIIQSISTAYRSDGLELAVVFFVRSCHYYFFLIDVNPNIATADTVFVSQWVSVYKEVTAARIFHRDNQTEL